MVQKLSGQHLVKETPQRPHIRSTCSPYLLPSIIVISLLLEMQSQCQHLRGFDTLSPSRFHVQLLLGLVIDTALSEIP
jgi:hypothetical protein